MWSYTIIWKNHKILLNYNDFRKFGLFKSGFKNRCYHLNKNNATWIVHAFTDEEITNLKIIQKCDVPNLY